MICPVSFVEDTRLLFERVLQEENNRESIKTGQNKKERNNPRRRDVKPKQTGVHKILWTDSFAWCGRYGRTGKKGKGCGYSRYKAEHCLIRVCLDSNHSVKIVIVTIKVQKPIAFPLAPLADGHAALCLRKRPLILHPSLPPATNYMGKEGT